MIDVFVVVYYDVVSSSRRPARRRCVRARRGGAGVSDTSSREDTEPSPNARGEEGNNACEYRRLLLLSRAAKARVFLCPIVMCGFCRQKIRVFVMHLSTTRYCEDETTGHHHHHQPTTTE